MKPKKLVIIGGGAFAEVAHQCFSHDSPYEVCGFSVEEAWIKKGSLFGLPVHPFETLEKHVSPEEAEFFAAVNFSQSNALRQRFYREAKAKGFRPASYLSSRASVWPGASVGEHSFIFEACVVEPFSRIGDNAVLWTGSRVLHHSIIEDNCFLVANALVSAYAKIGRNSTLGAGAIVASQVSIAEENWIGPGALILRDTPPQGRFEAAQSAALP